MKKMLLLVFLLTTIVLHGQGATEDIINDIYRQLIEEEDTEYEELQEDLLSIAEHPIDLNSATDQDLKRLRFLSDKQIDDILLYVYKHPLDSLYELRNISSLREYDIRNLCAFVVLRPAEAGQQKVYFKEAVKELKHEVSTRVDCRNAEQSKPDPFYLQTRYRLSYRDKFEVKLQLRRPTGGDAGSLEYGGYIGLKDIGPLSYVVLGNIQASFGQGLVMAPSFRLGRSMYVRSAGYEPEGVKGRSSVLEDGLHGIGLSTRWSVGKKMHLEASALYSLTREQDTIQRHVICANVTLKGRAWQVGVTTTENMWTDSIHPYANASYNQRYFRGRQQVVAGINARYRWRWLDIFGEIATTQNKQWGIGLQTGVRINPIERIEMLVLYRYYSPWFDNDLGYAYSETGRLGDEQGIYLGLDISKWEGWQLKAYTDLFRFEGIKYGIKYAPSMGYDANVESIFRRNNIWELRIRLRAREKARNGLYSALGQFRWTCNGWQLQTHIEGNLSRDSIGHLGWGLNISQDIGYEWQNVPLKLQLRLQGFDAQSWTNRIYMYENDVLYALSSQVAYGRGGRAYINLRWKILNSLSLYFKLSETVYAKSWATKQSRPQTRTDIHVMLRAKL